jgi:hypothetical protein
MFYVFDYASSPLAEKTSLFGHAFYFKKIRDLKSDV